MRALYREHTGGNVKIRKLIEAVAELEVQGPGVQRIEARETRTGWKLKAV
jgi:hypothetical protein